MTQSTTCFVHVRWLNSILKVWISRSFNANVKSGHYGREIHKLSVSLENIYMLWTQTRYNNLDVQSGWWAGQLVVNMYGTVPFEYVCLQYTVIFTTKILFGYNLYYFPLLFIIRNLPVAEKPMLYISLAYIPYIPCDRDIFMYFPGLFLHTESLIGLHSSARRRITHTIKRDKYRPLKKEVREMLWFLLFNMNYRSIITSVFNLQVFEDITSSFALIQFVFIKLRYVNAE